MSLRAALGVARLRLNDLPGDLAEIETLLSVVKTFDVDWLAGMSFVLYPLEFVDAKTVAGELSEVFAGPRSPIAGVVMVGGAPGATRCSGLGTGTLGRSGN